MNHSNGFHSNQQPAPETNGHGTNGHATNGSIAVTTATLNARAVNDPAQNGVTAHRQPRTIQAFDQPVILRQSPLWPRAVALTLIGVTTAVAIWAYVAQIEEAIPAQGKLEPEGAVTEVQAPVGGVVKEILVQDGQRVKKDELLIGLDPTADRAEQSSLRQIRSNLMQENQYYQMQMHGVASAPTQVLASLPSEPATLTKNRAELLAENQLYRTQLKGSNPGADFTVEQQERLQSSQAEVRSRISTAELEVDQLKRQLQETQVQLASAKDLLVVEKKIFQDLTPLVEQGGIARMQYLKQQQQVRTRQAEMDRLVQEQKRLQFAIAQSDEKVLNAIALTKKDLYDKIADNEKRVAEIDSQLTKNIVENEKRISEIDSQLSKNQQTLGYQALKAPVSGTVFDLQAHAPGFVTNSTTPILKIVPDESLVAKVFITNQDIGFVKEGMPVDVRIDSFPFSEFGDIKGKLVWVGSDALPPDNIYNFYRFPAKVRLDRQYLLINGRTVSLQSGMSISTNMKLRKRSVASIFTDLFTKKIESLKSVR